MTAESKVDVVVLGAGVLGLTIATELVDRGKKVAIVGKDLPEDIHSVGFASPWAGCNWHSAAGDDKEKQDWDRITFHKLAKLSEEHPDLCQRIPFYEYWTGENDEPASRWYNDLVFNLKTQTLKPEEGTFPGGFDTQLSFESYVTHAPKYIAHLADSLRKRGVQIIRHRVSSLDEAYDLPEFGPVDTVVNATGLGAKTLIGVEDDAVYPARGQTVLVRADVPEKACRHHTDPSWNVPGANKPPTYIIPRPGSSDEIILGGTYIADDYSSLPDPAAARQILENAYKIFPELAGPNGTSWRDIEIISHNVGLRPARRGGCRLELEKRSIASKLDLRPAAVKGPERQVQVVHAYGIGGAGYQASFGIAHRAADLIAPETS